DPAWKGGDYAEPPEQGIRLWRDILNFLAARSPEVSRDQFQNQMDVLPFLQAQETALIKAFDANDWIYQTWAYDRHDVGTTRGMAATLAGKAHHNPRFPPIACCRPPRILIVFSPCSQVTAEQPRDLRYHGRWTGFARGGARSEMGLSKC